MQLNGYIILEFLSIEVPISQSKMQELKQVFYCLSSTRNSLTFVINRKKEKKNDVDNEDDNFVKWKYKNESKDHYLHQPSLLVAWAEKFHKTSWIMSTELIETDPILFVLLIFDWIITSFSVSSLTKRYDIMLLQFLSDFFTDLLGVSVPTLLCSQTFFGLREMPMRDSTWRDGRWSQMRAGEEDLRGHVGLTCRNALNAGQRCPHSHFFRFYSCKSFAEVSYFLTLSLNQTKCDFLHRLADLW